MTLTVDTERPRSSSEGSRVSSYDNVLLPGTAVDGPANAAAEGTAPAAGDTEVPTMQIGLETIQLEAGIVQKCKRGTSLIVVPKMYFLCAKSTIYDSYKVLQAF